MSEWFKMQDENGVAHIEITTGIGGFFGLDPEEFVADLRNIEATDLRLLISSGGGSVFAGTRIYNALLEWKESNSAVITARVSSLAASMASVIAMAADKVEIYRNSFFMIHEAATESFGNAGDLERDADLLRKINENAVAAYMRHANIGEEQVRSMVAAETWLDARQSVEFGFADVIIDEDAPEARFDMSAFSKERIPEAAMEIVEQTTDEQEAPEVIETEDTEQEEVQDVSGEPEIEDAPEQSADEVEDGTNDDAAEPPASEQPEDEQPDEVDDEQDDSEVELSMVGFEDLQNAMDKTEEIRAELAKVRKEYWDEMAATHSEHETEMAALVADFQAKTTEICAEHAKALQVEKDKTAEAEAKLSKLTGGMKASENSEAPSQAMNWQEAIRECGGGEAGYVEARKKYPEIHKSFMDNTER